MKFNKFFMSLLGALTLVACSTNDLTDTDIEVPGLGTGENYISVAIEMPGGNLSRTTEGDFEDGTTEESQIKDLVFFFFDKNDECVDVQYFNNPTFTKPASTSGTVSNPNIEKYGVIEVRLKPGLSYSKIGVALNPASSTNTLMDEITSVEAFLTRTYEYANAVRADGSQQVMSNSVYYDTSAMTEDPLNKKKIDVVDIKAENIYTFEQKKHIDQLLASGEVKYVDIFVERVLAKVVVDKPEFDDTKYYIYEESGVKKTVLTIFNHISGTSTEVKVVPKVKGMVLTVLSPRTALVKPLNSTGLGYGRGNENDEGFGYKQFQWNDPLNKRSYWASTANYGKEEMVYYSWNQAELRGSDKITMYIHPNTQANRPIASNESGSLNTKVMVVAELHHYDNAGNDLGAIDLVKFGSDYMLAPDLLPYVASLVNRDIRNYDWAQWAVTNDVTLTQDDITAIHNAFLDENGYKGSQLHLSVFNPGEDNKFGDTDWSAKVEFSRPLVNPSLNDVTAASVNAVTEKIKQVREASIEAINTNNSILYWKDGKTYFFTNIRHQGFFGLAGNTDTDFLYGVVRNHVYKINLTGIYGLGTPVIDPGLPINPDRPNDDRPSYIKARINILPWRVVTNNATIH